MVRLVSKAPLKCLTLALAPILLTMFSFHTDRLQWLLVLSTQPMSTKALNFHCKSYMRPRCNYSTHNRCCAVMMVERQGRLGNRMFMFASALGIALTHSCQLAVDKEILDELKTIFTIDLRRISALRLVEPVEIQSCVDRKYNYCSYFPIKFQKNRYHAIELTGFWQSYRYFYAFKEVIKNQFRFQDSLKQKIVAFLRGKEHKYNARLIELHKNGQEDVHLEKNPHLSSFTWVGIHVRRGDFLYLRQVSSTYFINDAMYYFEKKYSNVIFLMASDDKPACKAMYGNRSNIVMTPVSFSTEEDLAALATCNHMIVTVGTFGWWAAFLNGGEVLHDVRFSKNPTPVDNNCSLQNYLPSTFLFFNKTF